MKRHFLIMASTVVFLFALTAQGFAKETTVRGRLQRTVESGGWLIVTDAEKYLLLNATRFQNESWFRESTRVEATGETKPGTVTIYQEGVPFEARTIHSLDDGGGSNNAGATTDNYRRYTRVLVTGDSIVQAQPDTAILSIAVVTQNKQALTAQQDNANRTDAVVRALKAIAGAGTEIKTSGYNLQPQRVYRENQPPTIVGYEARNTVTVTLSDLTKVGAVIDAAAQAGANNVDAVAFILRQDQAAKNQALTQATREAMTKARSIAQALGGRVVRIAQVEEEGYVRPLNYQAEARAMMAGSAGKIAAPTPVEVGSLDITSRVQLVAEIEQPQQ
jgi:uncharacterized protein YggE